MTPAEALPLSDEADLGTATASSYGLKRGILSPVETLAQSISTIAPTTSPTMTIPLVFALAGNATWLAYLLATAGVLLVALCVSRFARYSASPGSLYIYASTLRPVVGSITAWALLLAYIATAASVAGGFINYANVLLNLGFGLRAPQSLLAVIAVTVATAIAYRDVKVSARTMLWIEAVSITFISIVVAILLAKNGLHLHPAQLRLDGASSSGVRLGVVLALFSFVGFESATTLGAEAREPLRTIPRAVIQSAMLTGVFLILCAYTEVLGFAGAHQNFGSSDAPMHLLAQQAGVPLLGPLIDAGALVSMFACILACITAGARVLMLMGHNGLASRRLTQTHLRNATPGPAVVSVGVLTLLPAALLAARGASGSDIYGWLGSLATYGFITVYGLVALALAFYMRRQGHLTPAVILLSVTTTVAMVLALVGTLIPVPAAPYSWLPYVYLVYILAGLGWYFRLQSKRRRPAPQHQA
ncbi:MAG TPA: APC family permease [Acidisarcina sp.]